MHVYGITGPSGSGKSLLCEYLSAHGIVHINADAVYHEMLTPPSTVVDARVRQFGESVLAPDGGIDRRALSAIVFSSPLQLERLNQTVLPLVLDEVRARLARMEREGVRAVAIDAPTLIESGFDTECDTVVVVLSSIEQRIARIVERDGISNEHAKERIAAQNPDDFYIAHADAVLYNDGNRKAFLDQAQKVFSITNDTNI